MPEGQASRKPEQQAGPEQEQQAVPVREYRPAGHRSLGRSGLPIRSLRRISGKCASLFHNEGRIIHSPSALFDNKCRWPCFFLPYYPAFHGQSPNPRGTIVFYCIYEYYTSDGDTFQRQKPDSPNRKSPETRGERVPGLQEQGSKDVAEMVVRTSYTGCGRRSARK